MGRALAEWATSPSISHEVLSGSWQFLSGLPSADVNMAMVHTDDNDALAITLSAITNMNVPTVLFLAAAGKELSNRLPDEWTNVGVFPFMAKQLHASVDEFDYRVSVALLDDTAEVVGLLADSFLLEPNIFSFMIDTLKNPDSAVDIWVLKDNGVAVSTATTMRVDDALTVWCMATPPQFARKGYGKALLREVLSRSAANGARVGLLGATDAGRPLYEATGWETLEGWDVYVNALANH